MVVCVRCESLEHELAACPLPDPADIPEEARQLKAMATLFETPIEIKEVEDAWLMLTYDVPNDEKGQKARYEFLKWARQNGFVQHTESVYYGPWTHDANVAAIRLAEHGRVYALHSRPTTEEQAREFAAVYDREVMGWLDEAVDRLPGIRQHAADGKLGLAGKMLEHTVEMVKALVPSIERRHSQVLTEKLRSVRLAIAQAQMEAGL